MRDNKLSLTNVIKHVTSKESATQSDTSDAPKQNPPQATKDGDNQIQPELCDEKTLQEMPNDDANPGTSTQAIRQETEMDEGSTNVIPPTTITQTPGKPSPLTPRKKDQIDQLFSKEIEQGATQQLKSVRNKMCTTIVLRRLITSKSKVKQVTNYVNYLVAGRPSQDVKDLPEDKVQVDQWLEGLDADSSVRPGSRQFWDDANTKTIEKEFKKYKNCPTKGELKNIFLKNERLAAICDKEGFARCYEKVKSTMKRLRK